MKLVNETKHSVTVTNENKEQVVFDIDISDMIQVADITDMLVEYDEMQSIEFPNTTNIKELSKVMREIANKFEKVNILLDKAFGRELREKAFLGSSSMLMYNDFFEQLSEEMTKAGIKVETKAKELQKKYLLNDHRKSDTI